MFKLIVVLLNLRLIVRGTKSTGLACPKTEVEADSLACPSSVTHRGDAALAPSAAGRDLHCAEEEKSRMIFRALKLSLHFLFFPPAPRPWQPGSPNLPQFGGTCPLLSDRRLILLEQSTASEEKHSLVRHTIYSSMELFICIVWKTARFIC